MEYSYAVREDVTEDEEGNRRTVYGIDAFCCGTRVQSVPDVFCGKEKAVALVDTCNKLQLHIVHLMSVIEDAL